MPFSKPGNIGEAKAGYGGNDFSLIQLLQGIYIFHKLYYLRISNALIGYIDENNHVVLVLICK